MKYIALMLYILMSCTAMPALSQSCPPNIDFESGDFSNWECFTGTTTAATNNKNVINLSLSGPVTGRHEIISASSAVQLDPYGKFPTLCPYGGNYSVKLGNDLGGAQAEGLSYTFTVPSAVDTFTFTYFYAVVFEDPNHPAYQQPRFFVTAYEVATGKLISCASFDYIATSALPGFQKSVTRSSVLFKDWSPVSLQFAGLAGKQVRLEFKTGDCTPGGHFGYAYLDVGSGCSNILATAPYCVETNSLILNAPYGFKDYVWFDETYSKVIGKQQALTLSPPPATSGIFHVDVTPYEGYGCRDTMHAIVTPLPVPDMPEVSPEVNLCQYQSAQQLTAKATRGLALLWYTSATGGIASNIAPVPSTAKTGSTEYFVSQKALFGCESFRRKITVNIIPSPVTSFNVNRLRQCETGNEFIYSSQTLNQNTSEFTWDYGDGKILTSATDSVTKYTYGKNGSYTVKLKVTNAGICSAEKSVVIAVIPKPVAAFTYPAVICQNQTPVSISNTSTVPGNVSTITQWWWSLDGTVEQTKAPAVFTPVKAGSLPVRLVISTAEGCVSDTNNTVLPVHYQPAAAFKYSKLLCNNEIISFTDVSFLTGAPPSENIVKWYWQFDNGYTTSQQHPALNLAAGIQHIKLTSETDIGCKSGVADSSLVIHPKPAIGIAINDSCVFRNILYEAKELQNPVSRWYWNFGSGYKAGDKTVTRSYTSEGSRPVSIIGETIYNCKDTLYRPFTVYDNKALAGRDTIVAWDEPVQLNAGGGTNVTYIWSPHTGLSNPSIENPVATLDRDQTYRLDALTDKGCDSHSAILIKRYKGPELYIPTAFTPNNDGKNDQLKVFPVGIKAFNYLAVYDRFGQRIYYTTDYHQGWNGSYKGEALPPGIYVAYATAIDYKGNVLTGKASVMMIR